MSAIYDYSTVSQYSAIDSAFDRDPSPSITADDMEGLAELGHFHAASYEAPPLEKSGVTCHHASISEDAA